MEENIDIVQETKEPELKEINLGSNIYEMNKMFLQEEKALSKTKIRESIEKMFISMTKSSDRYFMLLNRELNDYTIFAIKDKSNIDTWKNNFSTELIDMLKNRGELLLIQNAVDSDNTFEVWIRDRVNSNVFVYYFFPYELGVIEV